VPLAEGEKPKLIFSEDIEADKEKYLKLGFVIIGEPEFENTNEVRFLKRKIDSHANRAIGHAMKVKATHILYLQKKLVNTVKPPLKTENMKLNFLKDFKIFPFIWLGGEFNERGVDCFLFL